MCVMNTSFNRQSIQTSPKSNLFHLLIFNLDSFFVCKLCWLFVRLYYSTNQIHDMRMIMTLYYIDDYVVFTDCKGATCPEIFYDTDYSTCTSTGGSEVKLPAYNNCCLLSSCMPDATGCTLHLKYGTTFDCGF